MSSQLDAIRKLRDAVVRRADESDVSKIPFKKWMRLANKAIEDITGMEADILPDVPWKDWYDNGTDPVAAASMALQGAEEEDDTFDAKKYLGDDYEEDDGPGEVESGENVSLRRRGFGAEEKCEDGFSSLYDLMESLGMTSARPKRRRLVEMADRYRARREEPREQIEEQDEEQAEEDDDSADSVTPEPVQEPARPPSDVDRAVGAIRAEEEAELARSKPSVVDEASVQGGDWGRWGDATKAAGEVGPDLASALSKATEEKYKFVQEGSASSAEAGSELWFEIEPENSESEIYYLGFKIREGEKGEKPSKWDVVLSRGKGLGSAKTIASRSGVKTSRLKSEAMKLVSGAKSEKPAEEKPADKE
jgi:hypothetical protein